MLDDVFEDQLHALHVFGNAVEYRFLQTDRDYIGRGSDLLQDAD